MDVRCSVVPCSRFQIIPKDRWQPHAKHFPLRYGDRPLLLYYLSTDATHDVSAYFRNLQLVCVIIQNSLYSGKFKDFYLSVVVKRFLFYSTFLIFGNDFPNTPNTS